MKFCLGEIVYSKLEFIKLADEVGKDYDLIEVWLDYISDWDLDFICEISEKYQDRLLILTRRNDANVFNLTSAQRKSILNTVSKYPVYIDLDFVVQKEDLDYLLSLSTKSKLILSYHNYHVTPDYNELDQILSAMKLLPANIYKIACFCHSIGDTLNLLKLKELQSTNKNDLIILGAGKFGLLSRFACYLDQQPIIYAPRTLNKSIINGQLSIKQYKLLEEMLNVR